MFFINEMNDSEIADKNIKIAEYMGLEITEPGISTNVIINNECVFISDLKYHLSWDWLMPVIDKIENLNAKTHLKDYRVDIDIRQCQIWDLNPSKEDIERLGDLAGFLIDADFHENKLYNAWEAVVAFIERYA